MEEIKQGRLYGYARVSTVEQNEEMQIKALRDRGCSKIYLDKITGGTLNRNELNKLLDGIRQGYIMKGDSILVWKLDRLSRSVKDLLEIKDLLEKHEVNLISIKESFDTATAAGKMMFSMIGVIAEMERDTIRERVNAGIRNAINNGVRFGKPRYSFTPAQVEMVKKRKAEGETYREIAKSLNISYDTIYKYIIRPIRDEAKKKKAEVGEG